MNKPNVLLKIDSTPFSDQPLVLRLRAPTIPKLRGIAFPTQPGGRGVVRLEATGGTGGYVYSDLSTSAYDGLPPGLSLNSTTGMITGTPTTVGRYRFRAQVQDSSATTVEEDFTLEIAGRLRPRNVRPVDGEGLFVYQYTFTVTGNTGSVTWALIDGTIPPGLSLSSGGVLNGTPDFTLTLDSYRFSLRATDAANSDTLDVTCDLKIYPTMLGFDVGGEYTIYAGTSFQGLASHLSVSGGKPPYRYEWDNLDQWPSITFDPSTQTFAGIVPLDSLTIGTLQAITGTVFDAIGQSIGPYGIRFIPVFAQEKTSAAENGTTVADGPTRYNFVDGINTTAHVQPNSDGSVDVSFDATGGGSGGGGGIVDSVEGDGSGGTVEVDNTDPANPVVSANGAVLAAAAYTDAAVRAKKITCSIFRGIGTIQPGNYATLDSAPGGTITGWRITSKDVGSISVDVRASTWPTRPTAGDSIVGDAAYEIKLTSADHNDGVTSSWTTDALTAGQRVEFYVTSASGVRDVTIQLEVA